MYTPILLYNCVLSTEIYMKLTANTIRMGIIYDLFGIRQVNKSVLYILSRGDTFIAYLLFRLRCCALFTLSAFLKYRKHNFIDQQGVSYNFKNEAYN